VDPDGLGPAGFNPPVLATSSNVDLEHPVLQSSQHAIANPAPGLAWDLSPGPHHGRLYLVYTDASTPDDPATSIYVRYSDDGGTTWGAPTQVNSDSSGNSHFLPRIAVDQSTGWVAVSWYDARFDDGKYGLGDTDGVANDEVTLFATASVDPKGLSFLPDVQLASGPSRPVNINTYVQWYSSFGGNSGLAFYNGTFYPAWADNSPFQSGNPDPGNFDIVTAAVSVPWVAGPVVRVTPQGNIDPLAVALGVGSDVYVRLHTPDPVPVWVEQPWAPISQPGVPATQPGLSLSQQTTSQLLATDAVFLTGGAGATRTAGPVLGLSSRSSGVAETGLGAAAEMGLLPGQ
jgi:hypothetical protein